MPQPNPDTGKIVAIKPETNYTPAPNAKDISREARNKNMWIYDPSSKSWYNPEEFQAKYERSVHGLEKFLNQVQVRDPFDGVSAGYKKLLDLQTRHEEFTKRVIGYYRQSSNKQ